MVRVKTPRETFSKKATPKRKSLKSAPARRLLSLLMCALMAASLLPVTALGAGAAGDLVTEQPVLLVSGDGIIAGGVYSAGNVSNEKSYTLAELQNMATTRLFSAINSSGTRRIYQSEGADVADLLGLSGYTGADAGAVSATDGYKVSVNLADPRYYYPNIGLGALDGMNADNEAGSVPAAALLAWKSAMNSKSSLPANAQDALDPPAPADMKDQSLQLQVGQKSVNDVNNSIFNSNVNKLLAGGALTSTPISIMGAGYSRGDLLLMPRAQREYTYTTKNGPRTDNVRGVPLAELLKNVDDSVMIEFYAADGYDLSGYAMQKSELVANNALLAYETFDGAAWQGIYGTDANNTANAGYFTLYVDGGKGPAKLIDTIGAMSYGDSQYKHINYSGSPYNLDAITSATLTVEGPGVVNSVPITVRELEETRGSNISRGVYSDLRGSVETQRMYEGVKVSSILDGMVNSNVIRLNDQVVVVFKDRWRQDVARMTYGDIKSAASPVMLAYGTSSTDGSNISPFVFNLAAGADPTLGNEDGPLKLVYNQGASPVTQFKSVAYMYIEEGTPPPGFTHIGTSDPAYNNVTNTEALLTFTGNGLGKEVNYTVGELERMASDASLSFQGAYSLSNTTYWYVNNYEGIDLWKLLLKMGVSPGSANDDSTLVSFASWDNYKITSQFSFYQLAHPDLFYYYEKSPLDMGTDRPTKEQLATPAYQPSNQVGDWEKDANGYPVKKGYPVLLAYGVNSYPYVRDAQMDGFRSGLGNDGGPMRLIYGKTDGLNRADPSAAENYAYFYNNGSQQLQRLQEIYVGDDTRYSTHLQNPLPAYSDMKDTPDALTVDIVVDGATQSHTFTLAELESILYGPGVTKTMRDDEGRQEKGYYAYKTYQGAPLEDLFEGVNLEYLLTEVIGLQGILGTVDLYSGDTLSATYDLRSLSDRGYNSMRGTSDLGMMVAFAKNGYPLVSGSGTTPGYISSDPDTGKDIKNNGGPLQFVRAQTEAESAAGVVDETTGGTKASVTNLTRIVVNLEPDPYAHTGGDNMALANQQVNFTGAVRLSDGVSLTVGALETKQRYIVDGTYTIGGASEFYRGLDLYALLNDKDIGASALMDQIVVKNADGDSKTLSFADLTNAGKKIILAYGSGAGDSAAPLSIAGGGPMRLVIDGGAAADCILNVSEIEVHARTITAWKHDFGVYAQYADSKLEVSGQNLVHNRTYTVAQLEAMDNIIVQDSYKVGANTVVVQGVDLYKLLQTIGFSGGADSSVITVYASDNYSPGPFTASQLKGGINGKPILVAFGQGSTATNGLPLVTDNKAAGYDSVADNQGGPLRLMVHDNSGWSVKYLTKIVVGAAGGNPDPDLQPAIDFTLYPGGENDMPQASVRAVVPDNAGGFWVGTNGAGAAYISASGKITSYTTTTTPALKTDFVTGIAIAPDGGVWLTQGGSVGSVNAPPSAHYGFACYKDGEFKFYDSTSANSTLTSDCVYGIDVGKDGCVWVASQHTLLNGGMQGGLTKFDPATGAWRTWTMADGLPTLSAWAVKADDKGGAWVTTYRTSNVTDVAWPDDSFAYVSAAGTVKSYAIPAETDLTWSRSVSIDPAGGVYITRMSGSNNPNTGGRLDYIAPDGSVRSYSGYDLIPDLQTYAKTGFNPEIRTVFVDNSGWLWLTTNGLGVYRCSVAGDGAISAVQSFSSYSGNWPAGPFDDVWSVSVTSAGKAYFGSNGGAAVADLGSTPPPGANYIGNATEATAQLKITGAVAKPGYFTYDGLKTYPGVIPTKRTYTWLNDAGSSGSLSMTGVYMEDLLKKVMKLSPDAASITVTASDGYERSFNLDSNELGVYWTDMGGNKQMLAWAEDGAATSSLRLIVGQASPESVNRPMWVNGITSIVVNTNSVVSGSGTPGKYNGGGESLDTSKGVTVTLGADVTVTDGAANASNTAQQIKDAIAAAHKLPDWQSTSGVIIQVDATTEENTTKTVYKLTPDALAVLTGDGRTGIELLTDQGSIMLSAALLKYLEGSGQGPLTVEIAALSPGEYLTAADITIRMGDKEISSFNTLLLVGLPLGKADDSQGEDGLVVWRLGADGQNTLIKLAAYDKASQTMKIGLSGLSTYAVGYAPVTFADIQGHWSQGNIEFLASRGIVNGRAPDVFDPSGTVTRAEFVKMLAESVDGNVIPSGGGSGFSDVPDGAWYSGYVRWASGLGVAQGYEDGSFRPNGLITRQEMAVMLMRYVKAMGMALQSAQGASGASAAYSDAAKIGAFAADSITQARQYGLMTGNADGSFNPGGTATRAEAAKVMKVYIEAVLGIETNLG